MTGDQQQQQQQYHGDELFQILIRGSQATQVLDEWIERRVQSDLRVRRARTSGHVVIETPDVLFANAVRIWFPSVQIAIKRRSIRQQ